MLTEFLGEVWGHQLRLLPKEDRKRAWGFVAGWNDGRWVDVPILAKRVGKYDLSKATENSDLYFTPNLFHDIRRVRGNTLPSAVMYQDLDEADPLSGFVWTPTYWWETSPKRHQALWFMNEAVEPPQFASLNKALNIASGADPGTWNLTRVLRIPGSYNFKRGCKVGPANAEEVKVAA